MFKSCVKSVLLTSGMYHCDNLNVKQDAETLKKKASTSFHRWWLREECRHQIFWDQTHT